MNPLTYYCDLPATQRLSKKYGAHLERLSAEDSLAIQAGLSISMHWIASCPGAEPELLPACTTEIQHSFDDEELIEIINQLDEELDDGWLAMQLVSGLANICSHKLASSSTRA
ncbi:hypothetical protein [Almyronema epifaneia]|uniref:Uncharacterized protein n=1 Tax=Almyronema epifaneia S1 TaxID=2991925 RepID=A0ABW6IK02_9CYAN